MRDGGLKSFQRRLQQLPKEVSSAMKPALEGAGDMVADAQRALAPVDTGDLEQSIHVTSPGEQTPAYSQPGGSQIAKENEVIVTVGDSDVRFAHLLEYGTRNSPAQPFFWPGYRLTRKRAAAKIKRAMAKAIKENWGK